jgi:hypothetical protein
MTGRSALATGAILVGLLFSSPVEAAELRGRMWASGQSSRAPQGATVTVTCGSSSKPTVSLASDGAYSVRGLPANANCQLVVKVGSKTSPVVRVRTNATVVRFNAEIRTLPDRVIVLPQ